jgi:TIR domain
MPREAKLSSSGIARNRNQVFISYSTKDERWLGQILLHLRPLVRSESIHVFSNKEIRAGQDWRGEIRDALETASIAILLVSSNFTSSDFIMSQELPPLLAAAEERGVIILPVIVDYFLYEVVPGLARFQAVNPPDRPLSAMRPSERSRVLAALTRRISETVDKAD